MFSLPMGSSLTSRVRIGVLESGWTDQLFVAEWIASIFILAAQDAAVDVKKPILLFMDGHDSHESLEIKAAVYKNRGNINIIVIGFPSKTTHKCQMLDVTIFAHTQKHWTK